jgi:site-specific DNA-methyltransferase (adenine-specific)
VEVNQIVLGDCQKVLNEVADNSVDQIVTDPPYGYSFMGKDWDKAVPKVAIWKECLRVLKAGAFAFVMSSPRADVLSHMIVNLSDAGFRCDFTPIYWAYASGFPKAMNVGKMVDKRLGIKRDIISGKSKPLEFAGKFDQRSSQDRPKDNGAISDEAKLLDGSYGGFQPKPAVEVIIVVMKPLSEKTFVDQALKNGKGITWLDNARIPFESLNNDVLRARNRQQKETMQVYEGGYNAINSGGDINGRFPANLLVSDDILNDGQQWEGKQNFQHSAKSIYGSKAEGQFYNGNAKGEWGSFSRYFSLDAWFSKTIKKLPLEVQRTFPFLIEPKASKAERNKNLDQLEKREVQTHGIVNADLSGDSHNTTGQRPAKRQNYHPTVKPLDLMSYLITLGSRTNDLVLDPFCGSGTTCLAAKMLGRHFLGIEVKEEYVKLAEVRVNGHKTLSEFEIMQFNSEKKESEKQ